MTDIAEAQRRPGWMLPVIALALGVVLLGAGIGVLAVRYDRVIVTSEAMTPTLAPNKQILVAQGASPHRGDMVMFDRSVWPDRQPGHTVFRVVGIGGDQVTCCDADGRVQVNGRAVTENYLRMDGDLPSYILVFDQKVPDGMVFVLGDWRTNAADSRIYGPVPESAIVGTVVINDFSLLSPPSPLTPPSAFTDAGLTGVSTADTPVVYAWWAMVVGAIWSLLAFIWVIVVGSRRAVRPQPVVLPALPAESHPAKGPGLLGEQ